MAKENSIEILNSNTPFRWFEVKNPFKSGGMFEGASLLIFENAKQLRKNMTAAEMALWLHLRKGINGFKIRRQHPIGSYIADFYCHKVKLVIEVDGTIHTKDDIKQTDKIKENDLINWGYSVMRFTNEDVLQKPETIIEVISQKIFELNNLQKQNTP